MSLKIHISYTPEDEAAAERIAARIRDILPRHKLKKSTGTPPYKHLYFIPTSGKKATKYGNNT